jgi:predicted nucleotidyltransferase component of viral defense system
MVKEVKKNISESVKARLLHYSKKYSIEYNSVLLQYAQERFLYRISKSNYIDNFILKGALLFLAYDISRYRPTKDIDFLGNSMTNDKDAIKSIIREIAALHFEDGIVFDSESITAEEIKEQDQMHGIRVKLISRLGTVRQRMQLDIGFGDIIYPGAVKINYPTLLDNEAPHVQVYSIESAVAEKFEAIVSLGIATSRLKDFYDIHFFALHHKFELQDLHNAFNKTFINRKTNIKNRQYIFSDRYKKDNNLQIFWEAFIKKRLLQSEYTFSEMVEKIQLFIEPACTDVNEEAIWDYTAWKWRLKY